MSLQSNTINLKTAVDLLKSLKTFVVDQREQFENFEAAALRIDGVEQEFRHDERKKYYLLTKHVHTMCLKIWVLEIFFLNYTLSNNWQFIYRSSNVLKCFCGIKKPTWTAEIDILTWVWSQRSQIVNMWPLKSSLFLLRIVKEKNHFLLKPGSKTNSEVHWVKYR